MPFEEASTNDHRPASRISRESMMSSLSAAMHSSPNFIQSSTPESRTVLPERSRNDNMFDITEGEPLRLASGTLSNASERLPDRQRFPNSHDQIFLMARAGVCSTLFVNRIVKS
jgi:hypothetical protein